MVAKPKPTKQDRPKKKKRAKIKIGTPDVWFSLCVRERADWTCQSCGKHYEPDYTDDGLPKNQALHCSHFIGRANYAVRFEPMNADAHCYGCHSKFEGNAHAFVEWKLCQLGQMRYEILIEKSNNILLGQQARREKLAISEHYKAEFFKMRKLRDSGQVGRINFTGYL